MDQFVLDLWYAIRGLIRRPFLSLTAIFTLALAIGANVTMFTLLDRLVLHPLDVKEPERLVTLERRNVFRGVESRLRRLTWEEHLRARAAQSTVENVAASGGGSEPLIERASGTPMNALFVSANYFSVLGIPPRIGRDFDDRDEDASAEPVGIVSDRTWRRLGADPNVIGRSIQVVSGSITIVGVAPASFVGTEYNGLPADVYLPLSTFRRLMNVQGNYLGTPIIDGQKYSPVVWLSLIARLKRGATRTQAAAEFTSLLGSSGNSIETMGLEDTAVPGRSRADVRRFAALLAASVGLTLLIGCANLASLLLSRVDERQPELAIRAALGASRGRILRQLALDAGVLAVAGGAVAVLIASWTLDAFAAFELPGGIAVRDLRNSVDARGVVFAALATTLAAAMFGLAPALRGSRQMLPSLKQTAARASNRGSSLLIGVQSALCLMLVFGAVAFARSLSEAWAVDLGVQTRGLFVTTLTPSRQRYDAERATRYVDEFEARAQAIPGVVAAAVGPPPLGGTSYGPVVEIDGESRTLPDRLLNAPVSAEYFRTLGQGVLSGRTFSAGDKRSSRVVAVINQAAAATLWPSVDPIGHRVRPQGLRDPAEVIGVVQNVNLTDLRRNAEPCVYLLRDQQPVSTRGALLLVRSNLNSAAVASEIRALAWNLDTSLPPAAITTLDDRINGILMPQRLGRVLLTLLSSTALSLVALGIYGVVASAVQRRTREIGVRVALGARATQVVRTTIETSMTAVASGLVIGVGGAWWGGRLLDRFMYGISGSDPVTIAFAVGLLLLIAAAGAVVPVRRALRINPMEALRAD